MSIRQFLITAILFSTIICGCKNRTNDNAQTETSLSLAGQWSFKLDPDNVGEKQKWFQAAFTDTITLPGSVVENGYGDDITLDTQWTGAPPGNFYQTSERYEKYRQPDNIKIPFWLQPKKNYVGKAWYQKHISIPVAWKDKNITLFLERCHWQTSVWIDDNFANTQNSLSTPHIYDLSKYLTPGEHRITICVDNTVKIDIGQWGHAVTDNTQTNWNGIIGRMDLTARDRVYIEDLQIYPELKDKSFVVSIWIKNQTQQPASGTINVSIDSLPGVSINFSTDSPLHNLQINYPLDQNIKLWEEFAPELHKLTAVLSTASCSDTYSVDFGLREFAHNGRNFTVNGRKTFLRGTLECCIFPQTGYPSMDVTAWERIYRICKEHGLNHMRFHSWCPPKAAFIAADRLGIMLQVELPLWSGEVGKDPALEPYLTSEMDRILKTYGNHPSFCMFVNGNELGGDWNVLDRLVKHGKVLDPRHLYSASTARKHLDSDQFYVTHATTAGRVRGLHGPSTDWDFSDSIKPLKVPVVSHEIGQHCVYPDFNEMKKYTGILQPKNFEIFKDSLQQNHMPHLAEDFLKASGKFQAACYKEEIEAALRTPDFGGFQLLDLHDFPGQGTALIGVLDPFWNSKGYITPDQYKRFCAPTVPLARMKKKEYTNDETFIADIQIAHFGNEPIKNAVITWTLTAENIDYSKSGKLEPVDIELGNGTRVGRINVPLEDITKPAKIIVTLNIKNTEFTNDYHIWVYPADTDITAPQDIILTNSFDDNVIKAIENKAKIILIPNDSKVFKNTCTINFNPIFWNGYMFDWERNHTLGVLTDPAHPALKNFPTDSHADWQWYSLMSNNIALDLKEFPPDFSPIVRVIDDWNINRRQAVIFECDVNGAKLIVCTPNLIDLKDKNPAAKQMLNSLLQYAASETFEPKTSVDIKTLNSVINIPSNMVDQK